MKRICKIISSALFILMIPFVVVSAQNKKSEQKLKVIIDDGSGKKVVIDTIFSDRPVPDSIVIKDGSVIYMKHIGNETELKHHKGKEHFIVTYSGDGKDEEKEVTIISSDSLHMKKAGGSGDVMYYSNSGLHERHGDKGQIIVEKTRFVIAKDGVVVTIESDDEAKAKELLKEIENKLGVK